MERNISSSRADSRSISTAAVRGARDRLLAVVSSFPFSGPVDRAAWLAGLLSCACRRAFDGPAPFFLVESSARGTGRSLLVEISSLIATGDTPIRLSPASSDDEAAGDIEAVAQHRHPVVVIDGISKRFGNPALDAVLVSDSWHSRSLGRSRGQALPLKTIWWGTGSRVEFDSRGDLARRTIRIRLDGDSEHQSEPVLSDVTAFTLGHRDKLLADAQTLVRSYQIRRAVDPLMLSSFGGYAAWSDCIRAAVVSVGMVDPVRSSSRNSRR